MPTYYAHSNFPTTDTKTKRRTLIRTGSKVTQADLNLSDAEWQELLDMGAVSEDEYSVPEGFSGSPREYHLERLAALNRGELGAKEMKEIEKEHAKLVNPKTSTGEAPTTATATA